MVRRKITRQVKKHANLTANTNTVANLVDFASNFTLYMLLFQFIGNPFGMFILGFCLNTGILAFSNNSATIAANRNKKNNGWANAGLITLILLSIGKTIASGIGMEILSNQDKLQQWKAQDLINQQQQKVEALNSDSIYKEDKQECEEKTAEFNAMAKDAPGRDKLYQELWGTWEERNTDWNAIAKAQRPLCERANLLQLEAQENYQQARIKFDTLLATRAEMGNDFEFLKTKMPIVYNTTFNQDGSFISAGTQVEVAMYTFYGKLTQSDFAGLGLNLGVLCISAITSFAAVAVTVWYVTREDVLDSHDQEYITQRERLINGLCDELRKEEEKEKDQGYEDN